MNPQRLPPPKISYGSSKTPTQNIIWILKKPPKYYMDPPPPPILYGAS